MILIKIYQWNILKMYQKSIKIVYYQNTYYQKNLKILSYLPSTQSFLSSHLNIDGIHSPKTDKKID